MDKKLLETTNLRVEIMNRERQVKEKLGQVVRIRGTQREYSSKPLLAFSNVF